jgi:hypothetical protein
MNPSSLLLRLVHIANEAQDAGNDGSGIVRIPDHAALTLEDLDRLIEALKRLEGGQ